MCCVFGIGERAHALTCSGAALAVVAATLIAATRNTVAAQEAHPSPVAVRLYHADPNHLWNRLQEGCCRSTRPTVFS